ncbi:protein kinase [Corallococcus coralloides]|uniref:non-specific serine/threonine protein kinase n=1 Tax=Corallococcus coralloides TaxID=184914 RepID=A0A410S259_CORCK|nr:serine/threonine-protein kinase [Corallococcus coralloides]QAT88168.1 protein kinase [Corallococcus coralloides]
MVIATIPAHLGPGQRVDGFRVVRPLGSGSYGAVLLVEKGGQRFAMKFSTHRASSGDEQQADARLMREAVCLLHLQDHPNIVRCWAHSRWPDIQNGWRYIILDYVEGYTLGEWLEKTHPTAHEVVRVFVKLASALAHAHSRGVFHRDVKLSNIVVRASDGEPFLLDFGVSSYLLAPELTDTPLPPGTRRYRSPEAARFLKQHGDERGARYPFKATDDVYALGLCLYDLLTIPRPVSDPPALYVGGRWTPPAPQTLNPRVPEALGRAALHFIARDPEQRAASAEVLRRELAELLPETGEAWRAEPLHGAAPPLQAVPAQASAQGRVPGRHGRRWVAAGASAALLLMAWVGFVGLRAPGFPEPRSPLGGDGMAPPAKMDASISARAPPSAPSPAPEVASPAPAPVPKESPPVKRAPVPMTPPPNADARKPKSLASRPSWPPPGWAGFLKTCAGASAAAALQLGCPGAQVRPEPGDCPAKAVDAMFNRKREDGLRMRPTDSFLIILDRRQPKSWDTHEGVFADGPVTGEIHDTSAPELPEGTLLSGYLWTRGEVFIGRYTEAHLPDGRTLPVCIELGDRNTQGYYPPFPGSKPGAVIMNRIVPANPVQRWH